MIGDSSSMRPRLSCDAEFCSRTFQPRKAGDLRENARAQGWATEVFIAVVLDLCPVHAGENYGRVVQRGGAL
jgi:hypothetical protein